jgi:hypothetical protein
MSSVRPSSRDDSRSTIRATRSSSVRAITAPTWGRSASASGSQPPSMTYTWSSDGGALVAAASTVVVSAVVVPLPAPPMHSR